MFKIGDYIINSKTINKTNNFVIFKIVESSESYLVEFICFVDNYQIIITTLIKPIQETISKSNTSWELVSDDLLGKLNTLLTFQ